MASSLASASAYDMPPPRIRLFTIPDFPMIGGPEVQNLDFLKVMHFVRASDDHQPITVSQIVQTNTVNIVCGTQVLFSQHDTMKLWIYWPGYKMFEQEIPVGLPRKWTGQPGCQGGHSNRVRALGPLMIIVGRALGRFLQSARTTPGPIDPALHRWSISAHPHIYNEDTIAPVGLRRLGAKEFQVRIEVYSPSAASTSGVPLFHHGSGGQISQF